MEEDGAFSGEDAKEELAAWDRFRRTSPPALIAWRESRYAAVIDILLAARDHYDSLRRERGQLNFQTS